MSTRKYIGYLLYRAYIDRHPEVKLQLQLCGQAHLGLAFNLPGASPITGLIICFTLITPIYTYVMLEIFNECDMDL